MVLSKLIVPIESDTVTLPTQWFLPSNSSKEQHRVQSETATFLVADPLKATILLLVSSELHLSLWRSHLAFKP